MVKPALNAEATPPGHLKAMQAINAIRGKIVCSAAVADPGFLQRGDANSPQGGGRQHTVLPKFPKNCMKLKEFGPPGACFPCPLGSATTL